MREDFDFWDTPLGQNILLIAGIAIVFAGLLWGSGAP